MYIYIYLSISISIGNGFINKLITGGNHIVVTIKFEKIGEGRGVPYYSQFTIVTIILVN